MALLGRPPRAAKINGPSRNAPAQFSHTRRQHDDLGLLLILLPLLVLPVISTPVHFVFQDFRNFNNGTQGVYLQGDAVVASTGYIQLTAGNSNSSSSRGRAVFEHVSLRKDSIAADFTTDFTFDIQKPGNQSKVEMADGLVAFFLSPYPSWIPANNSSGRTAGLVSEDIRSNWREFNKASAGNSSFAAVDFSSRHVGIDANTMKSIAHVNLSVPFGRGLATARVTYNSSTVTLSVLLNYNGTYRFSDGPILSQIVNLSEVLPEMVTVGVSASTGDLYAFHSLHSWTFNSTDLETSTAANQQGSQNRSRLKLLGLLVIGLACLLLRIKKSNKGKNAAAEGMDERDTDDGLFVEIEGETGPRKFAYEDLVTATGNFAEEAKLGEGGFGSVYRGFLRDLDSHVAIKRVGKRSKQGKKEYVAEIKIISRLRHRNLVQLLGWCHDHNDLLLVYELMPNGSLDTHLFSSSSENSSLLSWPIRYKIVHGLASAMLYLHEDCEQCVVHRDIKSSNVMLDSDFNAKLGDFGLARLVKHGGGLHSTALAGTMGYIAPECYNTSKGSKESDVYSFGVVSLEVACGRRCIDPMAEDCKVALLEWVWEMYGERRLSDVVDPKLGREYDQEQMERLLVVGLWCAFPDKERRPTIMQAINVLNLGAPLPTLPSKMPLPVYFWAPSFTDIQSMAQSSSSAPGSLLSGAISSTSGSQTFSSHSISQTNLSSAASLNLRSDKRSDAT